MQGPGTVTVASDSGYANVAADKWQGEGTSAGVSAEAHEAVLSLLKGSTFTALVPIPQSLLWLWQPSFHLQVI